MRADLSGREWQVVMAVVRLTFGFNRTWSEPISLRKLGGREGMEIPTGSIFLSIKTLLKRGILIQDKDGRWRLNDEFEKWLTVQSTEQQSVQSTEQKVFSTLNRSVQSTEQNAGIPYNKIKAKQKSKEKGVSSTSRQDVSKVITAYREAKGITADVALWNKANYPRAARAAQALLASLGGDADKAVAYLSEMGAYWDKNGMSWTLETIARNAGDGMKPSSKQSTKTSDVVDGYRVVR